MIERQKDGSVVAEMKHLGWLAPRRLLRKDELECLGRQLLIKDELEWLGRPAGTALTDLTEDEVSQLANRHLDESQDIKFFWRVWQQYSSSEIRWVMFSEARLDMLRAMLGDEWLDALVAETQAKWEQRFADAGSHGA